MVFQLHSDFMKIQTLFVLVIILPISGCLGWDESPEINPVDENNVSRIVFSSPTLDRSEDLGSSLSLEDELSESHVLLLWVSPQCGGCHNWTSNILDEGHYESWNDSGDLQILSIHRYIEFEDPESVMQVYGNQSSDQYTPWPVLVPTQNSQAVDLETGTKISGTIADAYDNPRTPSLLLINQQAEIVWKAESYYYDEVEIQEINEILEGLGD
tara:strand:+ start:860 stop:1498 length:639 start_codon:yes stop_codon:yes gene_type:complete